jgi:hypothetical protein
VVDKMTAVHMVDVHSPTTDGRTIVLSRYTEPDADQAVLLRHLSSICQLSRCPASLHRTLAKPSEHSQCDVDLGSAARAKSIR